MKTQHRTERSCTVGFTLVELMVVISIIAILATIVGLNLGSQIDRGNVNAAQAQIRNLKSAVIAYKLQHRMLPESLEAVAEGGFLESKWVPEDPWRNPYVYTREGGDFSILSYGSDGAPGGADFATDISTDDLGKPKDV